MKDQSTNMQQDVFPYMRNFISEINSPPNDFENVKHYMNNKDNPKPKTSNLTNQNFRNINNLSKSKNQKEKEILKNNISTSPMVKSEESFDTSKDSVHFKSFNLNNSIFVSNQSKLMNENMFNNNKEKMIKIPMENALKNQKLKEMAPGTSRGQNKAFFIKTKLESLLNTNF